MSEDGEQVLTERLYEKLQLIRRAEEVVADIYPTDKIKSPVHLSIGQETVAVGICDALRCDDIVSGTYRGHAAYLAKGGNLNAMMAELFGKATGCAGGKGGSMHLVDMNAGVLGSSAVVGSTVPIALGYAHALKREGKGRVIAAFHGDGASEEGAFWESLNFAVLHRLPMLFVCENNGLAIHEPLEKRWGALQIRPKVEAFGMPAITIEDGDVFAIRKRAGEFIAAMREGAGPAFIECKIYRWREHVGPGDDHGAGYRSAEAMKKWVKADQPTVLAQMIAPDAKAAIDARIEAQIADAVQFAEESPFPSLAELSTHVFAR